MGWLAGKGGASGTSWRGALPAAAVSLLITDCWEPGLCLSLFSRFSLFLQMSSSLLFLFLFSLLLPFHLFFPFAFFSPFHLCSSLSTFLLLTFLIYFSFTFSFLLKTGLETFLITLPFQSSPPEGFFFDFLLLTHFLPVFTHF